MQRVTYYLDYNYKTMKTFLSSTIGAKLPQHLHDILIGYMLGDGGIFYASKNSAFPRFEFSMGQDRLAFAQHLASLFAFYASNTLKEVKVQASTDLRSEHSGD